MDDGHDVGEYGARVADDYDDLYVGVLDTEGAVARLAELAGDGPVLELGVGTGRLAIPLAARGLEVHGIEGSADMVDRLRAKPGGHDVALTLGDFTTATVAGSFALAVLAFNTLYALPDQAAQVRCVANVARHLWPGGRFVVEGWLPEPGLPPGRSLRPRELAPGLVGLVVADHDGPAQVLDTQQVVLGGAHGVRVFGVRHRYVWPAELDLMAGMAGMALEHREADWRGTPFGPASAAHVSTYRLGRPGMGSSPAGS